MRGDCLECLNYTLVDGNLKCKMNVNIRNFIRQCPSKVKGVNKEVQGYRVCSDCGQTLPVSMYYKCERFKGGYSVYCKPCQLIRNKINRLNGNKDY